MVDVDVATASSQAAWLRAEAQYAEALAAFQGAGQAALEAVKDSAVDLARLRHVADRARDRYFRDVLH